MRRLAAIVIAITCTVGCTRHDKATTELRIGAILSLTGPQAEFGKRMQRGIQMAVEDLNQAQGGRKIRLSVEDSQTSPQAGLNAFTKLADIDNVDVVLGNGSFLSKAVAPTAEQQKRLFVAIGTSIPDLPSHYSYVARVSYTADATTPALAQVVAKECRRVSLMVVDDEYGRVVAGIFKKAFQSDGGEIVTEQSFPLSVTDASTLTEKALSGEPTGIVIAGYGPNLLPLIARIRALRPQIRIYTDVALADPDVYRNPSKGVDGVVTVALPLDGGITTTERQAQFFEKYKHQTGGETPDMWTALAYDAVFAIAKSAAASANGRPVKAGFVALGDFEGVSGQIHFTKDADSVIKMQVYRIEGSRLNPVTDAGKVHE